MALSLDTNLNPYFQLEKPFLFRCGCGFTSGRKSSTTEFASFRCCNLGQLGAIVKGYWIWIQSQSTASSVWAQVDVQCLLRDAHRIVRPTCLDVPFWSPNNEIVSNHCSILSLEKYIHTNSILECPLTVNF